MSIDWGPTGGLRFPKPEPRARTEGRKQRQQAKVTQTVRAAVFAQHHSRCVHCGHPAVHLHERRFRSLGGTISTTNSEPVCAACHAHIHGHRLKRKG